MYLEEKDLNKIAPCMATVKINL